MTHKGSETNSLELYETFTHIMPQWKPTALKHRDKNLNTGTRDTGANTDHHTIVFEHPMHDGTLAWETLITSRSIQGPYGTKFPLVTNNLKQRNWFHSLPSQRFQALLTLFPKSFSSFPHGTCLLSVSGRYLALEENYPPFCAPRPKYATLRSPTGWNELSTWTGFSPSLTFFSKKTYAGDDSSKGTQDYNSKTSLGFTFWALPCSVALTGGIIFIFFSSAYLYA